MAEHVVGRKIKNGEMSSELGTSCGSPPDDVFRLCNRADFHAKRSEADGEFKPPSEPLQDNMDITMTFASPQDHIMVLSTWLEQQETLTVLKFALPVDGQTTESIATGRKAVTMDWHAT